MKTIIATIVIISFLVLYLAVSTLLCWLAQPLMGL